VCTMRYHFVVPAAAGPLSAGDPTSLPGMVERSHATASAPDGSAGAQPITADAAGCNGHAAADAAGCNEYAAAGTAATTESAVGIGAAPADKQAAAAQSPGEPPGHETEAEDNAQPLQIALPADETLESPGGVGGGGSRVSAPPSIYDSRAHLLHGVLHQNGFGHLLRVNGEHDRLHIAPVGRAACCNAASTCCLWLRRAADCLYPVLHKISCSSTLAQLAGSPAAALVGGFTQAMHLSLCCTLQMTPRHHLRRHLFLTRGVGPGSGIHMGGGAEHVGDSAQHLDQHRQQALSSPAAGLEGGSTRVAGRQLMDLWDTLCTVLAARQVSVEDVSNKVGVASKFASI